MAETLQIPEAMQMTFRRLVRRMPAELRSDQKLLESIVVYLKLGGERLGRQRINVAIEKHREEVKYMKRKLREEAMIKAAAMMESESDEDENDEDVDDEDVDDDEYSTDDDFNRSSDYYD